MLAAWRDLPSRWVLMSHVSILERYEGGAFLHMELPWQCFGFDVENARYCG